MIIEKYRILWKCAYVEVNIWKWNLLFKQSHGVTGQDTRKREEKGKSLDVTWLSFPA